MQNQEISCLICSNGEHETQLLLCDGCNRGFHTFCLNMRTVPTGSWYCPRCSRLMATTTTTTTTKPKVVEPKQVCIYIRVSSKGQNAPEYGRVGMDTQNVKVLEFCMANNLYVKSCIAEVGSAYHVNTPKLSKLIQTLKPGVPIMVYSFNRFSRNVAHAKEMADAVHAKGSYIWSVMDQLTSKEPAFMSLIQAAENESFTLGQRISAAHKRIRTQGGFVGKKPFGYNKVRVDGVFKLQENQIEQVVMKKVREYAEVNGRTKALAFAIKKYYRYQWSISMINACVRDSVRRQYPVIDAAESGMNAMTEAIIEVEEELEDDDEQELYIVKRFHKIRVSQGVYQLLVEWEGMSNVGANCSCSWENVVSLHEDAPDMVEEYLVRSTSQLVPTVCQLLGLAAPATPVQQVRATVVPGAPKKRHHQDMDEDI
jgi:DNA invertase Pin-like site-specific DNA recombinase